MVKSLKKVGFVNKTYFSLQQKEIKAITIKQEQMISVETNKMRLKFYNLTSPNKKKEIMHLILPIYRFEVSPKFTSEKKLF